MTNLKVRVKKSIFLTVFVVIITALWWGGMTLNSFKMQTMLGLACLLLILIALLSKKWVDRTFKNGYPVYIFIIATALYLLLFFVWNYYFYSYLTHTDFKGNIFRDAFANYQAPFYASIGGQLADRWPALLSGGLFLLFIILYRRKLDKPGAFYPILALTAFQIVCYSWYPSTGQNLLGLPCHYASTAADLPFFADGRPLLAAYNDSMHLLGVHNNHYPPGYLLLLQIDNLYLPGLSKLLVFAAALLALFPLRGLMKLLGYGTAAIHLTLILYATGGAILYYPGIAMDPLMIPLSVSGIYLMLLSLKKQRITAAMAFGFVLAAYTFFTFTSLVFVMFCGFVLLFRLWFRLEKIKPLLISALITLATAGAVFLLLSLVFHFNIAECFINSLSNEKAQMEYSGIDNWVRYFFVATGNIIAYTGIVGLPSVALISYGILHRKRFLPQQPASILFAILTTIFVMAFSTHFYLEVERIWIFLTPFCFMAAGWIIGKLWDEKKRALVLSLLITGILVTALLNITLTRCV